MLVTLLFVVLMFGLAAVLAVGAVRRFRPLDETRWPELDGSHWWDDEDDGDDGSGGWGGVREPRRPLPSGSGAAAAVDPDELAA